MRPPKDFYAPLAVGAPRPLMTVPARPSRAIHFFDPSNAKMAAKVPEMVGTVDVLSVLLLVLAVGVVVTTARGNGPPVWFTCLWLAALGWNAYWWLGRTAIEVTVDGATLRWTTALRRGSAPLEDVVRIRASRTSRQLAVIERREGRPLMVPVRNGFGALERSIQAGAPAASIEER